MKVLIWNQDWLAAELRAAGHTVTTMGYAAHLDVQLDSPIIHIDKALQKIPGGDRPDLILVLDNSAPLGLDGLESTDIPTIFYSVDTHHHSELHIQLAKVFDATFVAQRDYIPSFEAAGVKTHWLPLWPSREVTPIEPKQYGAVFVGTLNPKLNPDRVKFFDALKEEVPLLCMTGSWGEIFDRSEIVINQTVKGDLNFRVFEAMCSGAVLLTERASNGLLDLFNDGEHLVTYTKGDVKEAVSRIRELLADKVKMQRIAAAGRAEILRRHRSIHRLGEVMAIAERLEKRPRGGMHLPLMFNFSSLGRRLIRLSPKLAVHALSIALKHAEEALEKGEKLLPPHDLFLIGAAIRLDHLVRSDGGLRLIERFAERFPELQALQLAIIREHLNSGRIDKATELARTHFTNEPLSVFKIAEDVVTPLLGDP